MTSKQKQAPAEPKPSFAYKAAKVALLAAANNPNPSLSSWEAAARALKKEFESKAIIEDFDCLIDGVLFILSGVDDGEGSINDPKIAHGLAEIRGALRRFK